MAHVAAVDAVDAVGEVVDPRLAVEGPGEASTSAATATLLGPAGPADGAARRARPHRPARAADAVLGVLAAAVASGPSDGSGSTGTSPSSRWPRPTSPPRCRRPRPTAAVADPLPPTAQPASRTTTVRAAPVDGLGHDHAMTVDVLADRLRGALPQEHPLLTGDRSADSDR